MMGAAVQDCIFSMNEQVTSSQIMQFRNDCAWCSPGGYQCGPGQKAGPEAKDGNRCQTGKPLMSALH